MHRFFFLITNASQIVDFKVLDQGSNLSDHLPLLVVLNCEMAENFSDEKKEKDIDITQTFLRWDYANVNDYYLLTGSQLQTLLSTYGTLLSADY